MAVLGVSIALAALSILLCRFKASAILTRLGLIVLAGGETSAHRKATSIEEKPSNFTTSITQDASVDTHKDASPSFTEHRPPPAIMTNDSPLPVSVTQEPPRQAQPTDATLMPPPPNPQRHSPASLRVPTTGPLPNRGPPSSQQQKQRGLASATLNPSNSATSSTLPLLSRPRKKVILSPGHSPLDWAQKTRTSAPQQLSGVPCPQRITPSQLAWATGRKGKPAWSSYKGRVYNITPYLKFHPGGEAELMRAAGRDAQPLFDEVHAWVNWENMLGPCLVGFLVQEQNESS